MLEEKKFCLLVMVIFSYILFNLVNLIKINRESSFNDSSKTPLGDFKLLILMNNEHSLYKEFLKEYNYTLKYSNRFFRR